jgi:acetoin utilization protein AcuB
MLMPAVSRFMTREPYRIASSASLYDARVMMERHNIRHLPVMEGDKLLGIISENDVRLVEAVPGVDLAHVTIARVLTAPTCVWGETSLDEVAEEMAKSKVDCVVVLGGHGVQGIFTSSDALRALGDVLQRATA